MGTRTVFESLCDVCAERHESETSNTLPSGWVWCLEKLVCPRCAGDVRMILDQGPLVHVGYFRQAGSGKVFHENYDPEKHPDDARIYALGHHRPANLRSTT